MSEQFENLSVIELRQKAKEMGVKLGAGINKQGIIDKLTEAAGQAQAESPAASYAEQTAIHTEPAPRPIRSAAIITDDEETDEDDVPVLTPNPALRAARSAQRPAAPAPGASSLSTISAKAPAFTMEGSRAWHNPRTYQGQNSYQRPQQPAQNAWSARPAQQNPTEQRTYTRSLPQQHTDTRLQQPRPAQQPTYVNRFGPEQPAQEPAEQRPANEYRYAPAQQDYSAPRDSAPSGYGYSQPAYQQHREPAAPNSAISEILAAGECGDGEGVLEVHPDGYGFLRTNHYLPGKQDVYISNAQIRRFGLRTGDYVAGKTRPQRESDRYSAMLYITEVNGAVPEEMPTRARFDELTAIYPKKRITLAGKREKDLALRVIDLMCPIGFGQRAMILCPPKVDRIALLKKLAAAVSKNHSKAQLMLLLVDERPEEVTDIKESVKGEVVYATFDEPPENQVRVAEMALERAMRMVEQKKDVVILADSLTRLARACNVIAPQTARTLGGGLAAGALNRPKKFFGAARNTREGGSLTIITTVLCDTGSELDTAILQEFRGNSNMTCALMPPAKELSMDPAVRVEDSGTIHNEWLLSETELALAEKMRGWIAGEKPQDALEKLNSLLSKNGDGEDVSPAQDSAEE